MREINVLALRKLSAGSRDGKTRQIRAIFQDIEELITAGVSYRQIVDELNKQGVVVSVSHFGVILHQLRKENKRKNVVPSIGLEIDRVDRTISHLIEVEATQKVDKPLTTNSKTAKDATTQATTKSIRAIFHNEIDISKYM